MKKYLIIITEVLIIAMLTSCGPKKSTEDVVKPDTTTYKPIIMEEETDENSGSIFGKDTVTSITEDTTTLVPKTQIGYRVQVFATFSEEKADMIAAEVRERTTSRVYVQYIAPYYKVRVGDCTNRSEAEVLKSSLYGLGYTDAFIAEDTINN